MNIKEVISKRFSTRDLDPTKKILEEDVYQPELETELEPEPEPIRISKRTGKPVRPLTELQKETLSKGRAIGVQKKKELVEGIDKDIIKQLKAEGKYRVFNDILRERGKFPKSIWYGKYSIKEITNFHLKNYASIIYSATYEYLSRIPHRDRRKKNSRPEPKAN